ncbi:MAG TPA: glycosyltransferase family 9 protein [Smithellaceae bacterium]|nr:glycosyltransferase family 9 protein [Smithellaceae bacterium]
MFQNILIFGHSNIGDVIYDLVVVNPLTKRYPGAKVSFLTSKRCQDIVKGYRGIDQIIIMDRHGKNKGLLNRLRFTSELRKRKFDLVVVLSSSLNWLFLGSQAIWRIRKSTGKQNCHPVDRYIDMLRSNGLMIEAASFGFNVSDEDNVFCESFLKEKGVLPQDKLIGILPLAAWPLKSWPVEKWNRLAELLEQRWGIKMLNLGKLPDNELGRRVAHEISESIIPADKTNLLQAKALLKRCEMFIGPDSSLLHLASCMGIETVGLYGPTPYERFYPYFHQNNIISVKKKLNCMPCSPGQQAIML